MDTRHNSLLTINAGSSSLKVVLYELDSGLVAPTRPFELAITDIGQPSSSVLVVVDGIPVIKQMYAIADHAVATDIFIQHLSDKIPMQSITAIGHRIVYAGPDYVQPTMIDDQLETTLRSLARFDPEHAPATLQLITSLKQRFPRAVHVACFDTAFFHDLPLVARHIAIPRRFTTGGVRRFGFHGLSYTHLMTTFQDIAGAEAASGRVILAHLGSGASVAALRGGKPIETTMGLTPTSGVVMGARSGDVDPNLAWFLQQQSGMTLDEYTHMINFESGLLAVSGLSSDMYTLLQSQTTNPHAAEAVDLFCYQVKKAIGALAATIGGVDSLVFSGGIGEKSAEIRSRICDGLGFLGVQLDESANATGGDLISAQGSGVGVHVIATDESRVIASQVGALLHTQTSQGDF